MEFKGTERDWQMSRCQLSNTINISCGLIVIANVNTRTFCGQDLPEETTANAQLIIAAPEMFEMLKSVWKLQKDNYGDGMSTHIELIGKAKEIESLLNKITQ